MAKHDALKALYVINALFVKQRDNIVANTHLGRGHAIDENLNNLNELTTFNKVGLDFHFMLFE